MNAAPDLADRLARIVREDRGRLLAVLIRSLGDFDLAEDALSDAMERALDHWARSGVPNNPQGWLLQVARRRAIDRIRRGQRLAARQPDIEMLMAEDEAARAAPVEEIPDERLRLIFTCCHPSLEPKTRVALTLRTVGGLTTREIARGFLDTEVAMGQRLSRAKAKIGAAAIPYKVPEREEWNDRLGSVLTVIYLIFNEGWTAGPGDAPIRDTLCDEALFLSRLLNDLAPGDAEIEGLLALLLLTLSRRKARHSPAGGLVPLDQQDRASWEQGLISEGIETLNTAVARGAPGPFQCQAAIQAVHAEAPSAEATDWTQIVLLYDRLLMFQRSPVIRLNRAVALMEAGLDDLAVAEMGTLAAPLAEYQPFYAAAAELAARRGEAEAAKNAYDKAIELSQSDDEKAWLAARRAALR